jgi:transposase
MSSRRKYTQEYKREAVQLAKSGDVPMSQVARDLGINPNMLARWCRELQGSAAKAFPGIGRPRDEEMAALKRELGRVTKERDFLREAAGFFARSSK